MTPLFPREANSIARLVLAAVGLGAIAVPSFFIAWARTPFVTRQQDVMDQPIEFDHRHHVKDDGIPCRYCHYEAWRSRYAGVPPTQVCMGCHSQVYAESARLEPVRASYFAKNPIPWNRVHRLPDFVYFDHSVHVTRGVDCTACHGNVDGMARVYPVAPLTMNWCLDCHRHPNEHIGHAAEGTPYAPPVNCSACHR